MKSWQSPLSKGDCATRIKCPPAAMREALNWRWRVEFYCVTSLYGHDKSESSQSAVNPLQCLEFRNLGAKAYPVQDALNLDGHAHLTQYNQRSHTTTHGEHKLPSASCMIKRLQLTGTGDLLQHPEGEHSDEGRPEAWTTAGEPFHVRRRGRTDARTIAPAPASENYRPELRLITFYFHPLVGTRNAGRQRSREHGYSRIPPPSHAPAWALLKGSTPQLRSAGFFPPPPSSHSAIPRDAFSPPTFYRATSTTHTQDIRSCQEGVGEGKLTEMQFWKYCDEILRRSTSLPRLAALRRAQPLFSKGYSTACVRMAEGEGSVVNTVISESLPAALGGMLASSARQKRRARRGPSTVRQIKVYYLVMDHSFIPPDRIFGRLEKALRTKPTIVAVSEIAKPQTHWHLKSSLSQRIVITQSKHGNVQVRGEVNYTIDLGKEHASANVVTVTPNLQPESK
ncbi:hypothetical protein PR048_017027 [Dryococelus australis]|uniref:Uncharacterized protein n=1 Tax=Dryococelus australis TaxID=614101 RepID=A0ABQ9H8F1_9NEOP|nr:hypothetical protein PR048_017027 [Dryococelus australis]